MSIEVSDPSGLKDSATALVYLLRDDQKVKVVARLAPSEVRNQSTHFTSTLSAVTGKIVNVDENFKFHENLDGSVDKTKTGMNQVYYILKNTLKNTLKKIT